MAPGRRRRPVHALRRLTGPWAALAGATLFAVHPVQVEVLALVAARNDSMAAVFVLSALLLVLNPTERSPLRLGGATWLVLSGLLSKESAILAPFMLVALDLARSNGVGASTLQAGGSIRVAAAVPVAPGQPGGVCTSPAARRR